MKLKIDGAYSKVIALIFAKHYVPGEKFFSFHREELANAARELGIDPPKNLGDIVYSFKFRRDLPQSIRDTETADLVWRIKNIGGSNYQFQLARPFTVTPQPNYIQTKIPDSTPGIVAKYAKGDEQALLARIRYNRLIDIFTQVTCYSLQNHLRTQVPDFAQIETDEVYVGIGKNGAHFAIPVQAKTGRDKLGESQIEQDIALCKHRFPELICRPIGAQFTGTDTIALFEFAEVEDEIRLVSEMHYRLVPPNEMTDDDLRSYRQILRSP
jgi:hypothetical protein